MSSITQALNKAREQILNEAQGRMGLVANEYLSKVKETAPLGYTGDLKRSFRIKISPDSNTFSVVSDVSYSLEQATKDYYHVKKEEVGGISFSAYAGIGRITQSDNSKRLYGSIEEEKYWIGLRWAINAGFPRYVWAYHKVAWDRVGGDNFMKRKMSEGR